MALKTPLYSFHKRLDAKLVNYANYLLPITYPQQTHVESHLQVRKSSGLFDVSHMLQNRLSGKHSVAFLQSLVPTDIAAIPIGTSHLSVFLNNNGGIIDDTIITRVGEDEIYFVTNGATTDKIDAHLKSQIEAFHSGSHDVSYSNFKSALVAVQGPKTHEFVGKLLSTGLTDIHFGSHFFFENGSKVIGKGFPKSFNDKSDTILVSRSGYTGEDGFEVSLPNSEKALEFVDQLIAAGGDQIKPIGLAARDSLRLEAGMCLYGNELSEEITPVEASLNWIISKSRRDGSSPFPGSEIILAQLKDKSLVSRKRIGFSYIDGPAARTGSKIFVKNGEDYEEVGVVTSGSPSPSLSASTGEKVNIGQGYITLPYSKKETPVYVQLRKKYVPATIKKLPLVETHYYK